MPVQYNDPALAGAASDIAKMFAPPSGADMAGFANAGLLRQKMGMLQQMYANPTDPNFDQRMIVLGNETGTNSMAAQNQNNATAQRGQDMTLKANVENSLLAPVGQGATRFVPGGIASQYDVPALEQGNIAAQPNELIQTPSGGTVAGRYMPSGDQVDAGNQLALQKSGAITPEMLVAKAMGTTPVEAIAGPGGTPQNVYRTESIGKQPVQVAGGVAQAYDTKIGGDLATEFQTIQQGAQAAQGTQNTISQMRNIMADPKFYSGPGSQQVETVKRFVAAIGLDPNAVSSMEQFNAMSNKLVVDGLNGSLGTGVSNADRQFIGNTKPNLGNTQQGNVALLDIMDKLAQRAQETAALARDYAKQHNGRLDANWQGFVDQWATAHPLFPQQDQTQQPDGGPQEGATATNPQTGQKAVFRNGAWQMVS